jgi:hypothetical protein
MKRIEFADFVSKMHLLHASAYTYPEQPDPWVGFKTRMLVVCPIHGEFRPLASNHASGTGCPGCSKGAKFMPEAEFIRKAREARGPRLDLSNLGYAGASKGTVNVVCSVHGPMKMRAKSLLLKGVGCTYCGNEKSQERKSEIVPESVWLSRAIEKHDGLYEYLDIWYDQEARLRILCKEHGEFVQSAKAHCSGQGCPTCGLSKRLGRNARPRSEWQEKFRQVYGDTYEYPEEQPRLKKLTVAVCKEHGEFQRYTSDLARGYGCPTCHNRSSIPQKELEVFCQSLGVPFVSNHKFAGRKELDLFFPSLNLGVEFDGCYWHSDAQSDRLNLARKSRLAVANGIRVIHIFEDEWANSRGPVEVMLRHAVGASERTQARKCDLVEVSSTEASLFHKNNHVQGSAPGQLLSMGLKFKGELVMVMTFTALNSVRRERQAGVVELRRMSSSMSVVGGASRLFKACVSVLKPAEVVSYSDSRAFEGKVYPILGFSLGGAVRPDYYYVRSGSPIRHRKSNFTRTRLSSDPRFDPALSEAANMRAMGWNRIYDCGKLRWVWKP